MLSHARWSFEWRGSIDDPSFPAREYEALVDRIPCATPFNRLEWLRAAQAAQPPGSAGVLLAWSGDALAGCLPIIWSSMRGLGAMGRRIRVARHLGYPMSDRVTLMVDPGEPGLLVEMLRRVRKHRPVAYVELSEMHNDSAAADELDAFARSDCIAMRRFETCQVPVLSLAEMRAEITALPTRVRAKIRRERRRASEAGAVVRRVVPTELDVGAWLDRIIRVEAGSWKGLAGLGIFSGADHARWIRTAFEALGRSGRIRIVALMIDDELISYRLGLLEAGRLYDYNLAFLEHQASIGSGRLLLNEWIEWGIDEGWAAVDASRVSRVSHHHLFERTRERVPHWQLRCYTKRPSGGFARLADLVWGTIKPWMAAQRRRVTRVRDQAADAAPRSDPGGGAA